MGGHDNSNRFLGRIRSSKPFTYTVVNSAVFTDAYIYGLIIPVLPFALVERVHLPESEVQEWIGILLGAYGAGLMVGSPIAGLFADRTNSRRGPYLWGLVALAVSTLAFSIGRTTLVLFVGRLIQGFSSAAVHTVGMAILADTVGQAGIGSAMGFVTMNIALGVVSGLTLGGILYHHFGYLAVFLSAYALVGLDFLLRVLMLGKEDREKGKNYIRRNQMDYGTASSKPCRPARSPSTSSSSSSSSLLSSTSSSPTSSLPSPESRHLAKIQAKPHRHPLLTLLTTPRMLTAILGDFTQATILTSLESILPLRTKLLFHYNSQRVALVFLPVSLAPLFGPLFGALSDRIGAKTMVCTGFLLTAPLLILLRLVDHYDESQVALLCVLLFLIGISLNMILTPVFSEASYVVDDLVATQPGVFGEKGAYAQAFGLMNVAYAAGSVVGPLMGGFLVERIGWEGVTCGMGIWCLGCVGPCFWTTGGRRRMEGRSEDGGGGDEI